MYSSDIRNQALETGFALAEYLLKIERYLRDASEAIARRVEHGEWCGLKPLDNPVEFYPEGAPLGRVKEREFLRNLLSLLEAHADCENVVRTCSDLAIEIGEAHLRLMDIARPLFLPPFNEPGNDGFAQSKLAEFAPGEASLMVETILSAGVKLMAQLRSIYLCEPDCSLLYPFNCTEPAELAPERVYFVWHGYNINQIPIRDIPAVTTACGVTDGVQLSAIFVYECLNIPRKLTIETINGRARAVEDSPEFLRLKCNRIAGATEKDRLTYLRGRIKILRKAKLLPAASPNKDA